MRKAETKFHNETSGWLSEDENGYHFEYDEHYLKSTKAEAISLTLPLQTDPYNSKVLFPFFDGLIPEGWLLDVAERLLLLCILYSMPSITPCDRVD